MKGCDTCTKHEVFIDELDGEEFFDGCGCQEDHEEHDQICLGVDGIYTPSEECPFFEEEKH